MRDHSSRTKQFDMKINNRKRQNKTKKKSDLLLFLCDLQSILSVRWLRPVGGYDGGSGSGSGDVDSHKNQNASH